MAFEEQALSGPNFRCVLPTSSSSYPSTGILRSASGTPALLLVILESAPRPFPAQVVAVAVSIRVFLAVSASLRWFPAGLTLGLPRLVLVLRGEFVFLPFPLAPRREIAMLIRRYSGDSQQISPGVSGFLAGSASSRTKFVLRHGGPALSAAVRGPGVPSAAPPVHATIDRSCATIRCAAVG